jgi:hypothetical protein
MHTIESAANSQPKILSMSTLKKAQSDISPEVTQPRSSQFLKATNPA